MQILSQHTVFPENRERALQKSEVHSSSFFGCFYRLHLLQEKTCHTAGVNNQEPAHRNHDPAGVRSRRDFFSLATR